MTVNTLSWHQGRRLHPTKRTTLKKKDRKTEAALEAVREEKKK